MKRRAKPVLPELAFLAKIDAGTSSMGLGPMSFNVRKARFNGWSDHEIRMCNQQLEGIVAQWTLIVRLREAANLRRCSNCNSLISTAYERCPACCTPK